MILHDTASAVIEKNGKFLLVKRANKPNKGYWAIPGGHVDEGESIYQAAMREMKEEVGDIKLDKKLALIFIHDVGIGHCHKCHVFLGKPAGKVRAGSDAAKIGWFTLEQMKKMNMTQYTVRIFNELYLKKV